MGLRVWTGPLRRVKEGAGALRGGRGLHGKLLVGLCWGHGGFVEIRRVGVGVCHGVLQSAELICR